MTRSYPPRGHSSFFLDHRNPIWSVGSAQSWGLTCDWSLTNLLFSLLPCSLRLGLWPNAGRDAYREIQQGLLRTTPLTTAISKSNRCLCQHTGCLLEVGLRDQTTYPPRLGVLTQQDFASHSSGSWISKMEVLAALLSPEVSPRGLWMTVVLRPHMASSPATSPWCLFLF